MTTTGLRNIHQRFYASTYGRFNSPDRYKASAGPRDPTSWNRYSYTRVDPVNRYDPSGMLDCDPDDPSCDPCEDGGCLCPDLVPTCGGDPGSPPPPGPGQSRLPPPKPASVVFVSATRARVNYALGCPNLPYGAYSQETFQILDQYGQPFQVGGLPVNETIRDGMVTTQFGSVPMTGPPTVKPGNAYNLPTSSDGLFLDYPFGGCGAIYNLHTFDQQYSVFYDGAWISLGPVFFVDQSEPLDTLSISTNYFAYTVTRSNPVIVPGLRGSRPPVPRRPGPIPLR
jgi:RHS repeat-associated protein